MLECLKFDITWTGPTDGALCGLTEFWSGSSPHLQVLSPEDCMHAVSQGALAVECRAGDEATLQLLSELQDLDTALSCVAERAFLRKLVGALKCSFSNWRILQRPLITLRSHAVNIFYCCCWKRQKSSSCDAQMNLTQRVLFPSMRSFLQAWFRNEANTESFVQEKIYFMEVSCRNGGLAC